MSTSMLEQAVIDAEALKEAAVKNAEQTILEKYSSEIGDAVASLLEQPEDDLMGMEDEEQEPREDVLDQLPLGATAGEELCPCPDDSTKVQIDLDQLETMMAKEDELDMEPQSLQESPVTDKEVDEEDLMEVSSMAVGAVEGGVIASSDDEEDLMEVDEEDLMEAISSALGKKKEKEEEELDISDEQLKDILEVLTVDLENVPSGMLFHNHPTEGENERSLDVALAKEQDTVYAEEQKELRDAIKKLQEQVKSQKLQLNKQKKDYVNLKSIAIKATKKLEEVNFSNAKLIYTNRVLKSASLNERQKNKLVEALSKVDSVEEAKIVFDTLNENLSSKGEEAPKTLNEAMSRNNPLILKSNKEKQPANSSQVDRMKKLAGLI